MQQDDYQAELQLVQRLYRCPEFFEDSARITGTELHRQQELRKIYSADLVRAGLQLADLRRKAAAKFSQSQAMWFDRIGLQQSSSERLSRWKAKRFQGRVIDACAGIGGDTLALAQTGLVLAVDCHPVRCRFIQWNADAYQVADRMEVVCSDVESLSPGDALLHIDPDQRAGRPGRSLRLEHCRPAYEYLLQCVERYRGGAIKLSPAANFCGKFDNVEIELISDQGECKQAVIWFGALRQQTPWRATALPAGETIAGDPLRVPTVVTPLAEYVFDPDPSVVRAGLVDLLASQQSLTRLDDAEEYLTGLQPVDSALLQGFRVVDALPYREKTIREYFRDSVYGELEIKCRHTPVKIEQLRGKLNLTGDQKGVLMIARLAGKTRALVCTRV